MKRINNISLLLLLGVLALGSCKKTTLETQNLNQPSYSVLDNENGTYAYAKGFYKIGFGDQAVGSLDDGLGYGMLVIVQGFHEGMGDNIFIPWGNNSYKFADNPLWVKLDNATKVNNPIGQGQISELKLRNDRAYGASNSFLPEWTYMYFLNNSSNLLLSKVDGIAFSGDAATKKKVLQAWAHWWKGYAYSRIGSMYIAGVIAETPNSTNGAFVDRNAMIAEANKNFDQAVTLLTGLSETVYDEVMKQIIPGYMQPANYGGIPSPAVWIKNINTMKARNLLVNKKTSDMTAADWAQILTLTNTGLTGPTDYPFLVKTFNDNSKSIFDKDFGTAGSYTATNDPTYSVSERLIQDFKPGDKRKANNFDLLASAVVNRRGRGITFGTRWYLVDGGTGNGAYTYFDFAIGATDYFIAGSYEENMLMKAEALINTSQINAGVAIIDAVRAYQGAGISSGAGLTLAQAKEELRKERRCALFLRGLAWYDLRRLGMNTSVDDGGTGRSGCVVLDANGTVNTNCQINYAYLSYWDVPQNELDFNAPATGSAPTNSPK
jgi:starch-binding outer membrane protein, SusD/RagB family